MTRRRVLPAVAGCATFRRETVALCQRRGAALPAARHRSARCRDRPRQRAGQCARRSGGRSTHGGAAQKRPYADRRARGHARVPPDTGRMARSTLGRALRGLRQRAGITQEELGVRIGHRSHLHLTRGGRADQPALGTLQRFLRALDATHADLAAEVERWLAELEIEPLRGLPRELWRYRASLSSVADLTSAETLAALGLPTAAPSRDQWPLFQDVGEQLHAVGCDGRVGVRAGPISVYGGGRRRRRPSNSAPGGNRTRGLRLERPLLFGSPKRTVDH